MDAFDHQQRLLSSSRRLTLSFGVAVLAVAVALSILATLLHSWVFGGVDASGRVAVTIAAALALSWLIVGASVYRRLQLRAGGSALAATLGASRVPRDAIEPLAKRLNTTVEIMALAAGLPVPTMYVLEQEQRINALVAGHGARDAVVVVTRGALEQLNDAELEAVVGHGLAQVLNGTARLNLRLAGLLFGLMAFGGMGRALWRDRAQIHDREAVLVAPFAAFLWLLGAAGWFVGKALRAVGQRQRILLADAAVARSATHQEALMGALARIAATPGGGQLDATEVDGIAHLLFVDGLGHDGWLATHPPLLERMQATKPGFRESMLEERIARLSLNGGAATPGAVSEPGARWPLPDATTATVVSAQAWAAHAGTWDQADYQRACAVLANLPEVLDGAARDPNEAVPLLGGLLFSADVAVEAKQRFELQARLGSEVTIQAADYAERIRGTHPMLRMPIAQLAVATLRHAPSGEVQRVRDAAFSLSHADGRLSLFEYALAQLIAEQLPTAPSGGSLVRSDAPLASAENAVVPLLALLAGGVHAQASDAARAFQQALHHALPASTARYAVPSAGPSSLDMGWAALQALEPDAQRRLLEAMVFATQVDGQVTAADAELLRLVSAVLGIPLPATVPAG